MTILGNQAAGDLQKDMDEIRSSRLCWSRESIRNGVLMLSDRLITIRQIAATVALCTVMSVTVQAQDAVMPVVPVAVPTTVAAPVGQNPGANPATNPTLNPALANPPKVVGAQGKNPGADPAQNPTLNPVLANPAKPVPSLAAALGQPGDGVNANNNPNARHEPAPTGTEPAGQESQANANPGMDLPVEEVAETPEQAQQKLRSEAYDTMMNGVLPMHPEELRDAFTKIDRNQKAIEEPLAYPKPEIAFTTISLDPATTPLTFKLATGHVTTVSFLDITGQPWPVKDITWAGNFEIKSSSQGVDERFPMYPNLLRIIPLSEYAYGNLSVRLLGLATPITFTLRTNREVVQYRLDLRVPEKGPFALPPIIETDNTNNLKAGDTTLTRIMEGVPPATAQRMDLDGVDGRTTAYQLDGTMYVRTPLTLLSPAWNGSVRSADGMNVYALNTAPVLLLSDQGQMVRASLHIGEGSTNGQ